MEGKNIVVWFSCGAASAVAAKKTVELYGHNNNITIINNRVKEEHPDNIRFKNDVSNWIGAEIITATSTAYPNASIIEVFDNRKYMSGTKGAPCTVALKKQARYEYEAKHRIDFHVMGFTVDEWERQKNFNAYERENTLPVLVSLLITKKDCFKILSKAGVTLPYIYSLGYPNANCIGCVKSSSPTYWNLVRNTFPETFKDRAEQSRRIGCKLVRVKGKRIFLDELKNTDVGGKIKNESCGVFCNNGEHTP